MPLPYRDRIGLVTVCFAPGKILFYKFDFKIRRFWCILTATKIPIQFDDSACWWGRATQHFLTDFAKNPTGSFGCKWGGVQS